MGQSKVDAHPGTLTGSIGVVSGKIVLGGAYDKFFLKTGHRPGKNSGILSSTNPFTDSEKRTRKH